MRAKADPKMREDQRSKDDSKVMAELREKAGQRGKFHQTEMVDPKPKVG